MKRNIYFKDLHEFTQNKILDEYGVRTPEELGLDREPYATVLIDDGGVAAVALTKLKLKTA